MVATIKNRIPCPFRPYPASSPVSLTEWLLLRGVWLGCLPPTRLIHEVMSSLPPGIGLIGVSEARLHEALELCLLRGWLILVNESHIAARRSLLSEEPHPLGLPRFGDVELTTDGELAYHQLTRDLFWGGSQYLGESTVHSSF